MPRKYHAYDLIRAIRLAYEAGLIGLNDACRAFKDAGWTENDALAEIGNWRKL